MKDFIPKGTGNSRWMKSSIPNGTTWEEALAMLRAGTFPFDLNGINSAGVAQKGDALNVANLLPNEVGALYGLGAEAVPKDVLAFLGKYSQHWWRRREIYYEYSTELGPQKSNSSSTRPTEGYALNDNITYTGYRSISYASSIYVGNDNKIHLSNPQTAKISRYQNDYNQAKNIFGKYWIPKYEGSDEDSVYFAPSSNTLYTDIFSARWFAFFSKYQKVSLISVKNYRDWEFVWSTDQDAYPKSGESGNYDYQYLGIPFERLIELMAQ